MDKLQLTGQNLGWFSNSICDGVHDVYFLCNRVQLPNLKLTTWPKQHLDLGPLDIELPTSAYLVFLQLMKKMFDIIFNWLRKKFLKN
jgi:hypothetical protein